MTPTTQNSTKVACGNCGAKNRVPAVAEGMPRCGKCSTPLRWVVDANDDEFHAVVDESSLPVLVDVWAPWCGPCRMVAPEIKKVAERQAGRFLVVKVNTEALPDLGARFGIRSIPTLAVFLGGKEVARTAGARPAPDIEKFAEQAVSKLRPPT